MGGFARIERSQWNPVAIATAALLAFSFVFGGASRQHELRLALVELVALPLLAISTLALLRSETQAGSRLAFGVLAALVLVPLLQLLPLPAGLWTNLPGRSDLVLALNLSDVPAGWSGISLTPERTWRSFLALLPPVAMFLGVLACPGDFRRRLGLPIIAMTVLAVALGSAQLASGGERLYPWATTDAGNVVGFFANRNHLATLCLISLPFATVLGAAALRRRSQGSLTLWLAILFIGLIVVALGVIRSRAGLLLVWPTLAVSLIASWIASGRGRPDIRLLAIAGAVTIAVIALAAFALDPIVARFNAGGTPEGRFENWPIVLQAADTYLPVGSGMGSFDAVYRSVEPLNRLDATYFNQAHNEYLESWLEAGWMGAAVLALFLFWFSRRAWAAWTARPSTERDLQRAASIAIGVVLLHSVADYPLRTVTISTLFALCCGLLELAHRSDVDLDAGRRAGHGRARRENRRT